eukprot:14393198-Alexandrium_andersonii.AAC.1
MMPKAVGDARLATMRVGAWGSRRSPSSGSASSRGAQKRALSLASVWPKPSLTRCACRGSS